MESRDRPLALSRLGDSDEELRRCIHCGLCLEACPTYPLRALEGESPRGRILLLRSLAERTLDPVREAFDPLRSCLGCGACQPACPSGVRYLDLFHDGRLSWRGSIDRALPWRLRLAKDLLLHRLLPRRGALRAIEAVSAAFGRLGVWSALAEGKIAREASAEARAWLSLLPSSEWAGSMRPDRQREVGQDAWDGAPVQLFHGCLAPILLPGVEPAARLLLERAGCRVTLPRRQSCCGALALHYGDPAVARSCLRRNVEVFAGTEGPIVVTAAGCSAALREADRAIPPGDPLHEAAVHVAARVRDLSVVLEERRGRLRWRREEIRVAFQDACHLKQVQGIAAQPRSLLESVPGLSLIEPLDVPGCCGSAGLYSFLHPREGREIGERMLSGLTEREVDWIVTTNPGCLLHLRMIARRARRRERILHLAEALALLLDDGRACSDPWGPGSSGRN